jgi:HSP20 family molecular chaperone IbpA
MSLFPFYRYRFFDDPFFFNELDFFDPWYDFTLFPPFVPITPQYRRFKHQERLTYSSTNVSNNSKSLEYIPRDPPAEKFRVQSNFQTGRRLEQVKNDNQSLVPFGQYRDSSFSNVESLDDSTLQPRIVNKGNNQKQLEVTVGVKNYLPQELQVSVKNNELIVQGEHQHKDVNGSERSFFFKSTTLPPGTQIDQLESHLDDNGQLKIEGPVL